jgi:hypothetical protein
MNFYQSITCISLLLYSALNIAAVPNELTLGGYVYKKADENIMGNHKSSEYIKAGETLNNWTSKVAIHLFMDSNDPVKLAQEKFGSSSKIELIGNDKNNILQLFDTMNTQGMQGDPVIFQQNVWRYQKLNYGKGIMAVEYTTSKLVPNQTTPTVTKEISQSLQNDIKALPVERYEY